MKTTITPYVRPDGIIVGIKGKAPEKEPFTGIPEVDSAIEDVHVEALTAFIQSGHPFEDQEWIKKTLIQRASLNLSLKELMEDASNGMWYVLHKDKLLPPIELDVMVVGQFMETECSGIYEYSTVLRIAKEEVKTYFPLHTRSERDFPEDFDQENGNYHNECCRCHKLFYGNKHRVVCKVCQPTEEATETQDELCTEMISKIQGMEFISAIDLVMEQFTIQRKTK